MTYVAGTFTLDTQDVRADAVEATYWIDATWGQRRRNGTCPVILHRITLLNWGVARYSRDLAVALAGDAEVERQEKMAGAAWLENAVQDDADEYADWKRDQQEADQ